MVLISGAFSRPLKARPPRYFSTRGWPRRRFDGMHNRLTRRADVPLPEIVRTGAPAPGSDALDAAVAGTLAALSGAPRQAAE